MHDLSQAQMSWQQQNSHANNRITPTDHHRIVPPELKAEPTPPIP